MSALLQSYHLGFQTLKVQKHATQIYSDLKLISRRFEKHFDGIRLLRVNTSFSFDPNSRLSKSKGANISDSVIKVIPIQAENNEGNEFLINVTGLFLSESLTTIKPIKNPEDKEDEFQWGQLSAEKSRIKSINN